MNCRLCWTYGEDPELQLRLRPLREQWEARGPGILACARTMFPWLSISEQLEIQLVKAQQGGGKVISATQIEFEAVLANRHQQLPEVVRLAWLILCAATDAKTASDESIAFIPAVLAAAEFVELARCDEPTVELALANWLETTPTISKTSNLHSWWEQTGRASCKDQDVWLAARHL